MIIKYGKRKKNKIKVLWQKVGLTFDLTFAKTLLVSHTFSPPLLFFRQTVTSH